VTPDQLAVENTRLIHELTAHVYWQTFCIGVLALGLIALAVMKWRTLVRMAQLETRQDEIFAKVIELLTVNREWVGVGREEMEKRQNHLAAVVGDKVDEKIKAAIVPPSESGDRLPVIPLPASGAIVRPAE
jgi:hypothetical protein